MRLRLATWNINSVRARIDQVERFVREEAPDVLCLQEIKCRDGEFPIGAFGVFARSNGEEPVSVTFSDFEVYDVNYTLPTKTPWPTP